MTEISPYGFVLITRSKLSAIDVAISIFKISE
jgi:hypothetical protein